MKRVRDMDVPAILNRFENEMFCADRKLEIADGLEFVLFNKDEDTVYCLQFDRLDKTYAITQVEFERDGGDYQEEVYLEKYPMDFYNREFVTSRIVELIKGVLNGK